MHPCDESAPFEFEIEKSAEDEYVACHSNDGQSNYTDRNFDTFKTMS